jgi:hypothetical protein
MEAIKLKGTSHNGKLTLSVPAEFDGKELELMIISSKEKKDDDHGKMEEDEIKEDKRKEKFMKNFGSAKHPDFPMTKYDV